MTRFAATLLTVATASLSPWAAQADEPVEFHGFASQAFLWAHHNQFLATDATKGSLQYNEIGLNAIKPITDNLRLGIQLFGRNLGDFGKNVVTIDWAYGDYRWRDWLGLRAGKIKMPLGLYNETRDVDSLRTSILLPQAVYEENTREVFVGMQGAGLYGHVPIPYLGSLSYAVQGGTVTVPPGGSTVRNIELAMGSAFTLQPSAYARVFLAHITWDTPLRGLRLAVSDFRTHWDMNGTTTELAKPLPTGRNATFSFDDFDRLVLSAEFVWRNLTLASEYQRTNTTVNGTIDISGMGLPTNSLVQSKARKLDGFYVSAAYRVANWLEAGTYYSAYYNDRDDRDGNKLAGTGQATFNGYQKDIALSLRFDIVDGWCAKVEGHRMFGAAQVQYNVADTVKDWTVFLAKTSFSF